MGMSANDSAEFYEEDQVPIYGITETRGAHIGLSNELTQGITGPFKVHGGLGEVLACNFDVAITPYRITTDTCICVWNGAPSWTCQ